MQFYRYAGFTVSEKWAEENDNRRVMREKVRKISMKTSDSLLGIGSFEVVKRE